eukprot:11722842-Alexandrium_andersonii.AAC.1
MGSTGGAKSGLARAAPVPASGSSASSSGRPRTAWIDQAAKAIVRSLSYRLSRWPAGSAVAH